MSENQASGGSADDGLAGLSVDASVCIGIGRCEMLEPEGFAVGDDGVARVSAELRLTTDRANELVMECPSGAISLG